MGLFSRSAGVLLHITSLPGKYGIGELGAEALDFVHWLKETGMSVWQVLPLGHTGFGDSPYQCFSAFAGNPLLISTDGLIKLGLITSDKVNGYAHDHDLSHTQVNYGPVYEFKQQVLRASFSKFQEKLHKNSQIKIDFESFCCNPENRWLHDYALFMSLKNEHNGKSWIDWDKALSSRQPQALEDARVRLKNEIDFYLFVQFIFYRQWSTVRHECAKCGISIIGDMPIYVAFDSADTWSNQSCFLLDNHGKPKSVSGVPPDYFSETGQLWGNPLYNWKTMKKAGYLWWVERFKSTFSLYDFVRLDHFRGFYGYWSVPANASTAAEGKWEKGPGTAFFRAIQSAFPKILPMIAEDLGEITSDVHEGRKELGMPGMKILQFAWSPKSAAPLIPDYGSTYLPHQIEENALVYTGTHDNDTTQGWWKCADENTRKCLQVYLAVDGFAIHADLMRTAFSTRAALAIVPVQDMLALGSDTRMNTPGKASGNWSWRLQANQLNSDVSGWVRGMLILYGRCANLSEEFKQRPAALPEY